MPAQIVRVDNLRTLPFGSISGTYAALGTSFAHPMRLICITNTTDALLTFSFDATVDNLIVPAGGFKLLDLTTNREESITFFVFAVGTQFYVKGSPGSGSVYLEAIYGQGE